MGKKCISETFSIVCLSTIGIAVSMVVGAPFHLTFHWSLQMEALSCVMYKCYLRVGHRSKMANKRRTHYWHAHCSILRIPQLYRTFRMLVNVTFPRKPSVLNIFFEIMLPHVCLPKSPFSSWYSTEPGSSHFSLKIDLHDPSPKDRKWLCVFIAHDLRRGKHFL